jgi:hypothetical protein
VQKKSFVRFAVVSPLFRWVSKFRRNVEALSLYFPRLRILYFSSHNYMPLSTWCLVLRKKLAKGQNLLIQIHRRIQALTAAMRWEELPLHNRAQRQLAVQFLSYDRSRAVCMNTGTWKCGEDVDQPITVFLVGTATEDGVFFFWVESAINYEQ